MSTGMQDRQHGSFPIGHGQWQVQTHAIGFNQCPPFIRRPVTIVQIKTHTKPGTQNQLKQTMVSGQTETRQILQQQGHAFFRLKPKIRFTAQSPSL